MSTLPLQFVLGLCLFAIAYGQNMVVHVIHAGILEDEQDVSTVSKAIDRLTLSDGLSASMTEDATLFDVYSSAFNDSAAFGANQTIDVDYTIYNTSFDALIKIIDDYADIDGLNEQLADSNLTESVYDMALWGNIVFCTDDEGVCEEMGEMNTDLFPEYHPVIATMSTDPVTTVWLDEGSSASDRIDVVSAWYMVYDDATDITTEIEALFPSADSHQSETWMSGDVGVDTNIAFGVHTAVYEESWESVSDDVGTPQSWDDWMEYYVGNDTDYILFVYSRGVLCSNDKVYVGYMASDDSGSGGYGFTGWEIIGIIFACIVGMAVMLLGVSYILTPKSPEEKKRKGGYKMGTSVDLDGDDEEVEMEANGHGLTTGK